MLPPAVERELAVGRSGGVNLPDLAMLPGVHVRVPAHTWPFILATTLGVGEREAPALAMEVPNFLLIMDDGQARRVGRLLELTMTGTVGVLTRAKCEGLIPRLRLLLNKLEGAWFST